MSSSISFRQLLSLKHIENLMNKLWIISKVSRHYRLVFRLYSHDINAIGISEKLSFSKRSW